MVRFADRVSTVVITVGGLTVVAAVLGIAVYLVSVVASLFTPGESALVTTFTASDLASPALFIEVDEFGSSAMQLTNDGQLRLFSLATGERIAAKQVFTESAAITCHARSVRNGAIALGLADGTTVLGSVRFETTFLTGDEPAELRDMRVGDRRQWGGVGGGGEGVVERTPIGQLRVVRAVSSFAKPVRLRKGAGAVRFVDYHRAPNKEYLVALRDDGSLLLNLVRRTESLMGGAPRLRVRTYPLPFTLPKGRTLADIAGVYVTGDGASVLVMYRDGLVQRFDTRDPKRAALAQTTTILDKGRTITSIGKLLGSRTFVIGDDTGDVFGVFVARNDFAQTPDRKTLVRAHEFRAGATSGLTTAATAIDASTRSRTFVVADAHGEVTVRNMTSHARVARLVHPDGGRIIDVALFPKVDGALAVAQSGDVAIWRLNPGHPEASAANLFGKVWYEGDAAPSFIYQSSSGDDAAEPKFSVVPLLFGTVKATFYTMLLAIPLGVLAAIYTSEFLTPKLRAAVKPSLEMMASLPSVVLGFIAAMLLAPLVRDWLPGVLLAFAAVPIGVLTGAHLWHFAPTRWTSRDAASGRLAMIAALTIVSSAVAISAGGLLESMLFNPSETDVLLRAGAYEPLPREQWPAWLGDIATIDAAAGRKLRAEGFAYRDGVVVKPAGSLDDPTIAATVRDNGFDRPSMRAWLDGVIGGAWPGWFLLAFPFCAIAMSMALTRVAGQVARRVDRRISQRGEACVELGKFTLSLILTLAIAAIVASAMTAAGLDVRDSIFGAYQQRNTLVVAIAMAVAVIPIIYTISDDAMTSVPASMRSASLGAGATRWQTAVRVVLPIAMSGVFSACMIGLGRAAGETMIVLMATGNTPIMSWSLFDGLRTLSANIAVELPEAPRDSTHYRVLFLCGLSLFIITFVINTVAEVVRQRVRKRSAML